MSILDFNEKILFEAPVKNCGNSPQSALDDHQNHSQNIINSVRGESGKQENSPLPVFPQLLCTPRTSAWPPPACPAASREKLSCSRRPVNRLERVGVLRSQLGLAAFQCSALETFCLAARDGALRCRNMRRAPAQAPCVMEREEKPTKATIFGP